MGTCANLLSTVSRMLSMYSEVYLCTHVLHSVIYLGVIQLPFIESHIHVHVRVQNSLY